MRPFWLLGLMLAIASLAGSAEAYGGQCPNVPSDDGVYYPYDSNPWWMQVCHQPAGDQAHPLYPAQSTNIPPEGIRVKKGEVAVLGNNGWINSDDGQRFGSGCWVRLPADAMAWDTVGESITNPPSWRIPYWSYCQNRSAPPAPAPAPPNLPPPPYSPPGSPQTGLWTYQNGQNLGAGWTTISVGSNELVAITTGPATYRNWSFPGGSDRGTVIIFAGNAYETVYLPFGGWIGRYTSPNPVNAWDSLRNDRINAMRGNNNCGVSYGCRWLDQLVVGSGGGTNILYGPTVGGPYY